MKRKYPSVFTAKGQDEFNLEYVVRTEKASVDHNNKPAAKGPITKARDPRVPGAK